MLPWPFELPADIGPGDWLEVGMLGAYASALRTDFNGFMPDTYVTVADAGPTPLVAEGVLETQA